MQRDNTPSPRVHKRDVPLSTASPPSAFLPSHRETPSSQSGRSGSDSDSHAALVRRLSPDKRCWPLPILSAAMNAMQSFCSLASQADCIVWLRLRVWVASEDAASHRYQPARRMSSNLILHYHPVASCIGQSAQSAYYTVTYALEHH